MVHSEISMNASKKESNSQQRNEIEEHNSKLSTSLPSLYTDGHVETEIPEYFWSKVESLTDESDVENDSDSSSSEGSDNYKGTKSELTEWNKDLGETLKLKSYDGSSFRVSSQKYKLSKRKFSHQSENGLDVNDAKMRREENDSSVSISNAVQRMMQSWGYKSGEGLGKFGQGRVAPVLVPERKGRRGLGVVVAEIDRNLIQFDPNKDDVVVHEEIDWLEGGHGIDLPFLDLLQWVVIGPKKRMLHDETNFCDPDILKCVLICKNAFDKMSGEEMRRARSRSNPFELIKKGPYLNRAAMKMANMDYNFDYMFTNPVDEYQMPVIRENELLYFADVCAGPGGFSEYVLSKKRWNAKGFGFTLKDDIDFKLSDFYAGPCESFEPFYGECKDGDVYKTKNIISFARYVSEHTDGLGVHFMMADGGFSVEGSENLQEILSKRLYLCQFLVALSIVRTGGHFVCKLFDVFTPFSVALIFLMYHCFKIICLHKPNTSRPANSERYIICKWKRENVDNIREYLLQVNENFDQFGSTNEEEVNELVPIDIMKGDEKFYNYVLRSNNTLGERQINSLAKILEYSEDENLVDERQQRLKKECMEAWKIPLGARKGPSDVHYETMCRNLLDDDVAFLRQPIKNIIGCQMEDALYTVHDWYAVILGDSSKTTSPGATFYLSVGHKKCFKFERSTARWTSITHLNLELSPETLVFGEIVPEYTDQSRRQMKLNVFQIIDGHTLGGRNISNLHYIERIALCALYAKSLTRPSILDPSPLMSLRVKTIYELPDLEQQCFYQMQIMEMKNGRKRLVIPISDAETNNQFYIPTGILFIKGTKMPYRRFISRTKNLKYYWAPNKESVYDDRRTEECINSFKSSYLESQFWHPDDSEENQFNAKTFVKELVLYIRRNLFTRKIERPVK